ncbi:MAG: type I-E CRISPR-associated protein Cse2/CasB [Gammaproteobacteria bacterium]|nr:type I-E CRISPR-associated protein Cse2/CasB [Gammaproteobacteria bacterium]
MSQQQPTTADAESRRKADSSIPTERSPRELHFTQEVIDTAQHYGWQPFHLRDRESAAIVRGRGFPDLVMYRGDQLIIAELKRDESSQLSADQVGWLDAFRQHVPAYEWRPGDWDEIENVLRHGGVVQSDGKTPASERRYLGTDQIPRNFHSVIQGLVETIEDKEFDRGDRSRLRRMDPDNPDTAAFWRLLVRAGMPENPDISKWGLIIHGMALMSHGAELAHNPRISVGRALYQGGGKRVPFYSEKRLSTLLAARGPTLHRLLARLFRMLSAEGCAFNWFEMTRFILYEGYDEGGADQIRVEIAREYYRAERQNTPSE